MPTLLMGHGQVMTDQPITIPDGFTISFLIDEARTMPFSNGVGVVMNIDTLQKEGFALASRHSGGEQIHNHALHVLTSNQRSWYAQVDPEDGSCRYAGEHFSDGARLCENPGPDGCARNAGGVHNCGGILSLALPDPNIVWVSCRQDASPDVWSKAQLTFGSEANDLANVQKTDFVAFATDADKRLRDDPANFATFFDSLSDEQIAQLMYKLPIRQWSFQREARRWLQGGTTDEEFYAFVQGQDETDQGLYLKDPQSGTKADDLRAAYEQGKFVRQAREYLEKAGSENFVLYVNRLDSTYRTMLEAYPDLAEALKVEADPLSAASQSARFGITVDEIDWSMVQAVNEKAIKDAPDGGDVAFWQLPSGQVLIGKDEQPETYRKLIELVRDGEANPSGNQPNGTITVTKGGITSRGRLRIRGATDEQTMRSWISAFSDKSMTFA
jgi:hypothetical protein